MLRENVEIVGKAKQHFSIKKKEAKQHFIIQKKRLVNRKGGYTSVVSFEDHPDCLGRDTQRRHCLPKCAPAANSG